MTIDANHWRRRLATLAEQHVVPGAALGILRLHGSPGDDGHDDDLVRVSHGLLNTVTGIEATDDSLWQIGSITKVWTATLAMQLSDEGLLDIDEPVTSYLPELRLSDADTEKALTMRHLLTHTSGIDGDVFTDTGRGDDCLAKYVSRLSEVPQLHPIGATWSYCNSGFSLAGRVIERLTGTTWDAAIRERITSPLGLAHTVTLPEEALLFRTAAGHVDMNGARRLTPRWGLPRSAGPAATICATPADVLAFARMHMTGGLAPDGTRILSEASVGAMAEFHSEVPDKYVLGHSWGLGWIRFDWGGHQLVGHDGSTIGQAAYLRVLPEAGLAVVLLANGGHDRDLYQDLCREIFAEIAGVEMAPTIHPPAESAAVDVTPHLGSYERDGLRIEVLAGGDGPMLRTTAFGSLADVTPEPIAEYPMTAISPDLYVVREAGTLTWLPVTFYELPSGKKYVHFAARATPKAE